MWVLCACIDLELHRDLLAERVLRKHTLYCVLDDTIWVRRTNFLELREASSTWVQRVAVVLLLVFALAGHLDLAGIDDDDEIAGINVRSECWLMLATEKASHLRSKTADRLPISIDDVPVSLYFAFLCGIGPLDRWIFRFRAHCETLFFAPFSGILGRLAAQQGQYIIPERISVLFIGGSIRGLECRKFRIFEGSGSGSGVCFQGSGGSSAAERPLSPKGVD